MPEITVSVFGVPIRLLADIEASHHLNNIAPLFPHSSLEPIANVSISLYKEKWLVSVHNKTTLLSLTADWPGLDDLLQILANHMVGGIRLLHASCVAFPGGAALFIGRSTLGKTTLALAFSKRWYKLLSEDLTPIKVKGTEVLPFVKSMNCRSDCGPHDAGTKRLAYKNADWANALTARFFFFLRNDSECNTNVRNGHGMTNVDKSDWIRMQELATGSVSGVFSKPENILRPLGPQDFNRVPKVTPIEEDEALKRFCRHIYPPRPALRQQLGEACTILKGVRSYSLWPGKIELTIDLICRTVAL